MPNKKKKQTKPVVVQIKTAPNRPKNAKRLRNKRRRLRQKRVKFGYPRALPGRTLSAYAGMRFETDAIARSTDQLLHSWFMPQHGVCRGIAAGAGPSGLCGFQDTYDVVVPALSFSNFIITPSAANANNFIQGNTGLLSNVGANLGSSPFSVLGTGVTQYVYPGPFQATNPSNGFWRPLGFQLQILPTSNVTSMAGYVNAAHIPELFTQYNPGSAAVSASNYTGPASNKELMNQLYRVKFNGVDKVVYNWFPSNNEIDIQPYGGVTTTSGMSGLYVSIANSSAAAVSYDLDYIIYYEYIPQITTVPFVEKKIADLHPVSYYYAQKFLAHFWKPAVLATLADWELMCESIDPMDGMFKTTIRSSFKMGISSKQAYSADLLSQISGILGAADSRVYRDISASKQVLTGNYEYNPLFDEGIKIGNQGWNPDDVD